MRRRNQADFIIRGKLYLGDLKSATSSNSLHQRKITHIVSCCFEPIPAHHPNSGYIIHQIPVADTSTDNILIYLPASCQFIHAAMCSPQSVVLVHGIQGLSRSATVVAAYLMWSRRMSVTDALTVVRQAREQVWVNPSFHEQLVIFEACRYNPHSREGIYIKWWCNLQEALRRVASRRLKELGRD